MDIKCTNRHLFTSFYIWFHLCLRSLGSSGKPTNVSHTHSLPLDALEMLLIGPYAAFHMGQFLMLTRVSFLSLLPESLLIFPYTSTRPFVSLRMFFPRLSYSLSLSQYPCCFSHIFTFLSSFLHFCCLSLVLCFNSFG